MMLYLTVFFILGLDLQYIGGSDAFKVPNFFTTIDVNLRINSELFRISKRKMLRLGKIYLTELFISDLLKLYFLGGCQ